MQRTSSDRETGAAAAAASAEPSQATAAVAAALAWHKSAWTAAHSLVLPYLARGALLEGRESARFLLSPPRLSLPSLMIRSVPKIRDICPMSSHPVAAAVFIWFRSLSVAPFSAVRINEMPAHAFLPSSLSLRMLRLRSYITLSLRSLLITLHAFTHVPCAAAVVAGSLCLCNIR